MAARSIPPDARSPVRIVDYDPMWPALFARERDLILRAIGPTIVAIEHVGSTAVPNLAAKPIIDILVGVPRLANAASCVDPLRRIGYEYVPEYEATTPDRRYFHKGPAADRTHHLHMVEFGGVFWKRHLLFRDFLRSHPERAHTYAELKRELASRHGDDRDAYTDGKTDFIESTIAEARGEKMALAAKKNFPSDA